MKKKYLAILLALVLTAGLLPTAFAADGTSGPCGENVTWSYSDGVLTIEGTGPMDDQKLTGSSLINVHVQQPWYDYNREIHTVKIGSGVTGIGDYSFYAMDLTGVTIPDSVTSIGDSAFEFCSDLTSVTIPDSVTTIGGGAFHNCESLTGIIIPDGVTTIQGLTFAGCGSLTSVTIPDSVTAIETNAFMGCWSLASVTVPSGVTSIGRMAFDDCVKLTDVYYGGSESQWKQISIDNEGNDRLTGAAIHYSVDKPETPTGFTDVPAGIWYEKAVSWAVEHNITSGTGDSTFTPDRVCSHGEIITFLWRAAGKPAATTQAPVETEPYDDFRAAADWAYENGIIDGSFRTGAECTRADTVTYMWKAAGSPNDAPASSFPDVPAENAAAVSWAVSKEVTFGTGDGTTFSPEITCDRSQIVTFLHRAYA